MRRLQRKICKVNSNLTPSNIGRWLHSSRSRNKNMTLKKRKRIRSTKKTSKSFNRSKKTVNKVKK